jgi:NAD(P)-dependent dehydrogenase (short-subunit alcohol dehydrogenase family)
MPRMLDGRVAIVTGAGRGLGRSHALALAADGARVVVNDYAPPGSDNPAEEVAAEIEASGGAALAHAGDVSSWDDSGKLVRLAIDTWGSLDVLVNNAGILRDRMIFNMSEDEWDAVIRVHLKGHFCPTRHAVEHWRAQSKESGAPVYGRIVNTTSEAGLVGSAGQPNYAAAKGGIIQLTLSTANGMARHGVTANAIAPRARTRMTENLFGGGMAAPGDGFDKFDPKNVSQLVTFLATPEAGDISGQVFVVYGGDIWVMGGFHLVGEVHRESMWTPGELAKAKGEMFKGVSSGVPPFNIA